MPSNETLKQYAIDIEVNTKKALDELDKLQKQVDKGVKSGAIKKSTQDSVSQIEGMIKGLSDSIAKESAAIKNNLSNSFKGIKAGELEKQFQEVNKSISSVTDKINLLSNALNKSDFSKFENYIQAFISPMGELNKTISELTTTLTSMVEPLQTISKMKIGAIDTSAFEQSINSLKPITKKAKDELIKAFDDLSAEIQEELLEDGKFVDFSALDNDLAANISKHIKSALSLLSKSSKEYSFNIGDIFNDAGLSFDESKLKTIAKKLDQQILEALPEGKSKGGRKSGITSSTTIKITPTAELSDDDVNKFVNDLSEKINNKVQNKLNDSVAVKVPIKGDTVGLKKEIEGTIKEFNRNAKTDDSLKVDVPIRTFIDNDSLNTLRSRLQKELNEGEGLSVNSSTNISGIEGISSDVSAIRNILSNGIPISGVGSNGELSLQTNNVNINSNSQGGQRIRGYELLFNNQLKNPGAQKTRSESEAMYNISMETKKGYEDIIKSIVKFFDGSSKISPLDALKKNKLYTETTSDEQYAKYGAGKKTEEFQKELENIVQSVVNAIESETNEVRSKFEKLKTSSLKDSKQYMIDEINAQKNDATSTRNVNKFISKNREVLEQYRNEYQQLEIQKLEERLKDVRKAASVEKEILDANDNLNNLSKADQKKYEKVKGSIKEAGVLENKITELKNTPKMSIEDAAVRMISEQFNSAIEKVKSSSRMSDGLREYLDAAAQRAIKEIIDKYRTSEDSELYNMRQRASSSAKSFKENISFSDNKAARKTLEEELGLSSYKLDNATIKELANILSNTLNYDTNISKAGKIITSMADEADKANAVYQFMKQIDIQAEETLKSYENQRSVLETIKQLQSDTSKDNTKRIKSLMSDDITRKLMTDENGVIRSVDEAFDELDNIMKIISRNASIVKKELATNVYSSIGSEKKYEANKEKYLQQTEELKRLSGYNADTLTKTEKERFDYLQRSVKALREEISVYEDINNIENRIVASAKNRASEENKNKEILSEQAEFLVYGFSKKGQAAYKDVSTLSKSDYTGASIEQLTDAAKKHELVLKELIKTNEKYTDDQINKTADKKVNDQIKERITYLELEKKAIQDNIAAQKERAEKNGWSYNPEYDQKRIEQINEDISYLKSGTGVANRELERKRAELEKLLEEISSFEKSGINDSSLFTEMINKRDELIRSIKYLSEKYEDENGNPISYESKARNKIVSDLEKERELLQNTINLETQKRDIVLEEISKRENDLQDRERILSTSISEERKKINAEYKTSNSEINAQLAEEKKNRSDLNKELDAINKKHDESISKAREELKIREEELQNARAVLQGESRKTAGNTSNNISELELQTKELDKQVLKAKEKLKEEEKSKQNELEQSQILAKIEQSDKNILSLEAQKNKNKTDKESRLAELELLKKQQAILKEQDKKEAKEISVTKRKSDEIAAKEAAEAKAKAEFELLSLEEQIAKLNKDIKKSTGEQKEQLKEKLKQVEAEYVAQLNILEAQEKQKEAAKQTELAQKQETEHAQRKAEKALQAGTITGANGAITGNIALGDIATETTLQKILNILSGGKIFKNNRNTETKKEEIDSTNESSSASKKNSASKKEEASVTKEVADKSKKVSSAERERIKTLDDEVARINQLKQKNKKNDAIRDLFTNNPELFKKYALKEDGTGKQSIISKSGEKYKADPAKYDAITEQIKQSWNATFEDIFKGIKSSAEKYSSNTRKALDSLLKTEGLTDKQKKDVVRTGVENGFILGKNNTTGQEYFKNPQYKNVSITQEDIDRTNEYLTAKNKLALADINAAKAEKESAQSTRESSKADAEAAKIAEESANIVEKSEEKKRAAKKQTKNVNTDIGATDLENQAVNELNKSIKVIEQVSKKYGQEVVMKFAEGIEASTPEEQKAFDRLAKVGIDTVKNILGISSPSTVFKEIGFWTDEGLAEGIIDNADLVKKAIIKMLKSSKITPEQAKELIDWDGIIDDASYGKGKIGKSVFGDRRKNETTERLNAFRNDVTEALKAFNNDSIFKGIDSTMNKLLDHGFNTDKIDLFKNKVLGLQNELAKLKENWTGSPEDITKLETIKNALSDLKATAKDYKQTISGKDFSPINAEEVKNINDLAASMMELAKARGYSNVIVPKYNKDQKQLTITARDEKNQLIQLTGAINDVNHSMYVGQPVVKQSISFWNTYSTTLKQAFSTFGYYLGFAAIIRRTMQEFRQGIQTLKTFDSALTTISYTMQLSQDELKELGQSAVNMAEDLSMSMENALKVYQIYANMQTTAKEIEEVAKPTAILSNLSGVDASTAADQVQGILQQFNMLKDGEEDVAETSMHVVDVLDKISANIAVDYSKGIGIISEAVTATGQVAHDAGMSFEELAAITAKVAERTREDGSTIGNAMKTMFVRISKVSKMPQYADEVNNEEISKAAKALHDIGIEVYNTNGEFNNITDTLSQLNEKWDSLNDVQKSNISFQIAATRQSAKFKSMLEAWTGAMDLANEATNANGNALENQEKFEESYAGKMQRLQTEWQEFWLNMLNSDGFKGLIDALTKLIEFINELADRTSHLGVVITGLGLASLLSTTVKIGKQFLTNVLAVRAMTTASKINSDVVKEEAASYAQLASTAESAASAKRDASIAGNETKVATAAGSGIGGSLAIGGIILLIGGLIVSAYKLHGVNEELLDDLGKTYNEYNNNSKSIENYRKKLLELKKTADDNNLSLEDQQEARKNIISLQSEMIETFGEEASTINGLTQSVNDLNNAFDELNNKEIQKWINNYNKENGGFWYNLSFPTGQTRTGVNYEYTPTPAMNMLDTAYKYKNPGRLFGGDAFGQFNRRNDLRKELNDTFKELFDKELSYEKSSYIENGVTKYHEDIGRLENTNVFELYDALIEMQSKYQKLVNSDPNNKAYKKSLDDITNQITEIQDIVNNREAIEKLNAYYNIIPKYNTDIKNIEADREELLKAVENQDEESISTYAKNINDTIDIILRKSGNDSSVKTWLDSFVANIQDYLSENEFQINIKVNTSKDGKLYNEIQNMLNGISDLQIVNQEDIINIASSEISSSDIARTYGRNFSLIIETIRNWAKEYNIPIELVVDEINVPKKAIKDLQQRFGKEKLSKLSDSDIQDLAEIPGIMRMSWEEALNALIDYQNQLGKPVDEKGIIDQLTDMTDGFDKLDEIYADILDGGKFDFTKLSTKKFEESFEGLDNEYQEFIKSVSANPDSIEKTQEAFNKLATAFIDNKLALDDLSEADKQVAIDMLKTMGVENAEEVVLDRVARKQKDLALEKEFTASTSKMLSKATLGEIDSFIKEENKSAETRQELVRLALQKLTVNGTVLDFSGDISNIIGFVEVLGGATTALQRLQDIKNGVSRNLADQGYSGSMDETTRRKQLETDAKAEVKNILADFKSNVNYGGADKTQAAIDKANKSGEESREILDWIEVAIKRVQEEVTRLGKLVSATYRNWSTRNSSIVSEMGAVRKEIELQLSAYQAYLREAEKIPLAEHYKKLVREGGLFSEEITDKNLKKRIDEYQDLYNKAIQAQDAVEDLYASIAQLAKQKFDNVANEFDGYISDIEHRVNYINNVLSNVETRNKIAGKSFYDALMEQERNNADQLKKELSSLAGALQDALSSGAIEYGSEEFNNMKSKIYSVEEAIQESTNKLEELSRNLKKLQNLILIILHSSLKTLLE